MITNDELQQLRLIEKDLDLVAYQVKELFKKISVLKEEIQSLKRTEMFFAREWWKDGKYLYLVFPQDKDGNRERRYVGNDPIKVAKARAKVERWERHRDLCRKLESAQSEVLLCKSSVGMTLHRLRSHTGNGDNQQSVAGNLRHQNLNVSGEVQC